MPTPGSAPPGAPATSSTWLIRGAIGAVIAIMLNVLIGVLYRNITGTSLQGMSPFSPAAPPLQLLPIAIGSALPPLGAALFAIVLAKTTGEPRRWFLGAGVILALLAVVMPLSVANAGANQVTLVAMSLIVVAAPFLLIGPTVPVLAGSSSRPPGAAG